MKPDEKIVERWWAIFDEEIRQAARHFAGANLPPSAVGAVFQRVVYGAAERSLKTTIRLLKSSKGGKEGAKKKRADADARHAEARLKMAQALARNARSRRKQSTRGLALEIQPMLGTWLSVSTLERLIRQIRGAKKIRHIGGV